MDSFKAIYRKNGMSWYNKNNIELGVGQENNMDQLWFFCLLYKQLLTQY